MLRLWVSCVGYEGCRTVCQRRATLNPVQWDLIRDAASNSFRIVELLIMQLSFTGFAQHQHPFALVYRCQRLARLSPLLARIVERLLFGVLRALNRALCPSNHHALNAWKGFDKRRDSVTCALAALASCPVRLPGLAASRASIHASEHGRGQTKSQLHQTSAST